MPPQGMQSQYSLISYPPAPPPPAGPPPPYMPSPPGTAQAPPSFREFSGMSQFPQTPTYGSPQITSQWQSPPPRYATPHHGHSPATTPIPASSPVLYPSSPVNIPAPAQQPLINTYDPPTIHQPQPHRPNPQYPPSPTLQYSTTVQIQPPANEWSAPPLTQPCNPNAPTIPPSASYIHCQPRPQSMVNLGFALPPTSDNAGLRKKKSWRDLGGILG
jgi:hypothetical protein